MEKERPDVQLLKKGYEKAGTNDKGILVIHGIGGSPAEMYLTAERFHEKGYGYKAIALPGHATSIEELDKVHYQEWVDASNKGLEELKEKYHKVYIMGLSMGGLIGVRLCELHNDISAAIFMAPALSYKAKYVPIAGYLAPIMKHLPMTPLTGFPGDNGYYLTGGYNTANSLHAVGQMTKLQKIAKKDIKSLQVPFVCFLSEADSLVDYKGDQKILKKAGTNDREFVIYPKSSHVLSLDINEGDLFAEGYRFFEKH